MWLALSSSSLLFLALPQTNYDESLNLTLLPFSTAVILGLLLFGWLGGDSVSGLINMDITSNQITCRGIQRQKLDYHYLRVLKIK
jgi:hypothetical protein